MSHFTQPTKWVGAVGIGLLATATACGTSSKPDSSQGGASGQAGAAGSASQGGSVDEGGGGGEATSAGEAGAGHAGEDGSAQAGAGGDGSAGEQPGECGAPVARSWASGDVSEVLALLATPDALWVAGYEAADNLDREGDSLGFVERWPTRGGRERRYVYDGAGSDAISALTADVAGRVWFAGATDRAGFTNLDLVFGSLDGAAEASGVTTHSLEANQNSTSMRVHGDQLLIAGLDLVYIEDHAVIRFEDPITTWVDITQPDTPQVTMSQRFETNAPDGFAAVGFLNDRPWLAGFRSGGAASGGFVKLLSAAGEHLAEYRLAEGPLASVAGLVEYEGALYVAGTTAGKVGDRSFGGQDGFFGRLGASGEFAFVTQFGTERAELVRTLTVEASGNFYVAGEVEGNSDGYDIFAARFDAEGNQTGSFSAGSAFDETVTSIAVDSCGVTYLAGSTLGDLVGSDARQLAARQAYVLPVTWR